MVETNNTLLVDGPASIRLVSGRAEVFGYQMKEKPIIVRQNKRLPFYATEKSVFKIQIGANAAIQEVEGNTIPQSWNEAVQTISEIQSKPTTIVVVGQSDLGKSSLCTYLVNKFLDGKNRVAVLDGDIGQSDIGPSATVGYGIASRPITKLTNVRLINAFFVGSTSPVKAMAKVLTGLASLKSELLERHPDFVIVNTDGWISGELGTQYKTALIKQLKPDVVVGIKVADELATIVANIEMPVVLVEPSASLSERSLEKRKRLREMTYIRYLGHSRVQCYPISELKVEPKSAIPINQTPDKGILVGLYDNGNKFLGIGVLRYVNRVRKVLKVQTPVASKPMRLVFGKVVLDEKFQELD
ncbi:MAG: Clp1/GlmU family protein [Betaproteobacteria bacterium]